MADKVIKISETAYYNLKFFLNNQSMRDKASEIILNYANASDSAKKKAYATGFKKGYQKGRYEKTDTAFRSR